MAYHNAWGRKGRIALPIYGLKDPILFDREHMDEFELYRADVPIPIPSVR